MSETVLSALGDASVRSAVAAALVAIVLATLRIRSSSVRHASWTAVLAAMLLMPVLPYCVPTIPIPVPAPATRSGAHTLAADERIRSNTGTPSIERDALAERPRISMSSQAVSNASTARAPALSDSAGRGLPRWRVAVLTVYAFGCFVLFVGTGIGWRGARRLARMSTPVDSDVDVAIRESPLVAAPITVGVLAPIILLPTGWRRWPGETLRAVLAHEIAHVRRRDPLVALVAHINRCVFWFHPLAWWLERALARYAEDASDDLALRVVRERARYAEILVDMARAVRGRGGRVNWAGLRVDGRGLLGARIDRVLSGEQAEPTAARKAAVAAACAAAIVAVVACRTQPAISHENASVEARDRALRIELERVAADPGRPFNRRDWDWIQDSLDALDAAVAARPDDLDAIRQWLIAYWADYAPRATSGGSRLIVDRVVDQKLLISRRSQILRLIEQHPESALAGSIVAQVFAQNLEPFFPGDPAGHAQARTAWMAQVNRPGATSAILGNASYFFEPFDKPLAEQLLLRARAIDPNGPWAARLGRFYALVLAGREVPAGQSSIRTVASPEPNSPFGVAVRRMLAQSTDDVLLTATGWFLVRSQSTLREWNGIHAGAWAKTCFERALWLNPDAVLAHAELLNVSYSQRLRRAYESTLWAPAPIALSSSIAALPEGERFAKLPALARNAYTALEDMARWNDPNLRDRMALERYHAEAFARETLELAERHRSDPQYGTAVYTANMVLGALTLRDGDRSAASAFLLNASKAPPTEELAYREDVVSGVHWHLARDLLERGERDAVAQFLDRMAQINVVRRLELRDAAAAIRRGETPKLAW